MAEQAAPLLTLDALTERPVVVIAARPPFWRGVRDRLRGHRPARVRAEYGMRTRDELSILDLHRLRRKADRLDTLLRLTSPSEAEEAELAALLDGLARELLVDVPDYIHRQLTDGQRLRIVETFTQLLRTTRPTAGAAAAGAASPTSERSFPGSSGSSAATP